MLGEGDRDGQLGQGGWVGSFVTSQEVAESSPEGLSLTGLVGGVGFAVQFEGRPDG